MITVEMKRAISKIVLSKEEFLAMHSRTPLHAKVYDDILLLVGEVVTSKISIRKAAQVLCMYSTLLLCKHTVTTREMFYQKRALFKNTSQVQALIRAAASGLKVNSSAFNIVPSLKGLACGPFSITAHGMETHFSGVCAIPRLADGAAALSSADIVLVVEKEAIFHTLVQKKEEIEARVGKTMLIVTGKGYPCRNTLVLLMHLSHIKTVGIFDCDPHGLNIFKVYKQGSRKNPHLCLPRLSRAGVYLSEVENLAALSSILPSSKEYALLRNITPKQAAALDIAHDLAYMVLHQKKASIEDVLISASLPLYFSLKIRELFSYTDSSSRS